VVRELPMNDHRERRLHMKSSIAAHKLGMTVALVGALVTLTSGAAHAQDPSVVTTGHACMTSEPSDNEVFIFFNPDFGGACAALFPGLYPTSAHFGLPNDSISSIKVGSSVRARLFWDGPYAGSFFFARPGHMRNISGGFDNQVSSIRVELTNRSENCGETFDGEIALFRDAHLTGDCIVLPGSRSYPTTFVMGIANDSISSIVNRTPRRLQIFWNANFDNMAQQLLPFTFVTSLHGDGFMTVGINDNTSSVKMVDPP
jgi:hypothetical protein